MKAMILAAGFGTRLGSFTNSVPKALVRINGSPLLLLLLNRLAANGFNEIAINAHYFADQIFEFIQDYSKKDGIKVCFSFEEKILDTGGGIKKMLHYFSGDEPILVHNVDILCNIDYTELMKHHIANTAACTLAVQKRLTNRPLLFDEKMRFLGRPPESQQKFFGRKFGFCGIQVIQPHIFENLHEECFYSIDAYENVLKFGKKIIGYDIKDTYWLDIGAPEDLKQAERDGTTGAIHFF